MKKKVLYWGDAPSPLVFTGFAKVAKYILKALHDTGLYDINILGINFFGGFFDKEEVPYQVVPAKLNNPNDPFGFEMLLKEIATNHYDILFVINDIYVTQKIAQNLNELRAKKPNLKIVYYFPVDCRVIPEASDFIRLADCAVTYNEWSKAETESALPFMKGRVKVINHGTDNTIFKRLPDKDRLHFRKGVFNLDFNDDTFIFFNGNRNSPRKDLPKCIYAFKLFKEQLKAKGKNALLYLHTMPQDNGTDLFMAVKNLGLSLQEDVVFPTKYNLTNNALPEPMLNQLFNAADCNITTTLGEGWGLFQSDSLAAKCPVIAPNHTSYPEMLGFGTRGFLYECEDVTFVDNSGYRPLGRMDTIVKTMQTAYDMIMSNKHFPMVLDGKKYVESIDWSIISKQWVSLFAEVSKQKTAPIIIEQI